MKIAYFKNSDGGCDYYRALLPMETIKAQRMAQVESLWPANIVADITCNPDKFRKVMNADVFLLQRVIGKNFVKKIHEVIMANKQGNKIVIDHDDNVFRVSPLSNHYSDFGTENIKIESNGKLIYEWKDGQNIDLKKNRERIDEIKWSLENCDMLTVTTDILADAFRPYCENIRVLPNCVDMKIWNRLPLIRPNPDEIRLYWSGGHSHWEDLFMVKEVLMEVARKHKNVKIVISGWKPMGMEEDYPKEQFEFRPWSDTLAYPYTTAINDPDIAIIPLVDNEFNSCKSAIKWIEMAALKVPAVVSMVSPYKELIDLKEDNGIFIERNDKTAWVKGIELLINDVELRKKIGQNAYDTVKENFDINTQYHAWFNAYGEVLSASTVKSNA
jgi:glycosyltransferase involved in cell wall biosynthesis